MVYRAERPRVTVILKPVALASVRMDGDTQPRAGISEETIATYTEHMRGLSAQFPPIVVFFDGVDHWLADGFHRCHAAKRIGREELKAEVHTGTRRDAILYAACANQAHGLPRTHADKRKAVSVLLADPEWRQWNNCEIGRRVGVGEHLVREMRPIFARGEDAARKVERGGTVYEQNTANIGKGPKDPSRTREAVAQRRKDISDMAERGFTTRQIAAAIGINESTVGEIAKVEGVVIHADRVVGKTKRHDANRIVSTMVMDAENLTADVNLIEFRELDPSQLSAWIHSLNASRKALGAFIRRLEEEQKKHGQAA